jgi:hypothetical protein
MHMRDDPPALADQRAGDGRSDPFAAAGYDCGSFSRHSSCLSLRAQRRNPGRRDGLLHRAAPRNDGNMPESRPPIELQGISLTELQRLIDERRLPPVERWNPERCGHSGMRIARDGTWYHEGQPIRRPAMVRLFSTVLRREPDGSHVLVTPAEKLTIEVESTAFRAVEMRSEGEGRNRQIVFRLDSGDAVMVGSGHPLHIVEAGHGPSPRILVRHGLEAELTRPVYYELAELALGQDEERPGVWSNGVFFPLDSLG